MDLDSRKATRKMKVRRDCGRTMGKKEREKKIHALSYTHKVGRNLKNKPRKEKEMEGEEKV